MNNMHRRNFFKGTAWSSLVEPIERSVREKRYVDVANLGPSVGGVQAAESSLDVR